MLAVKAEKVSLTPVVEKDKIRPRKIDRMTAVWARECPHRFPNYRVSANAAG
jgi:hypothetical protein